MSAETRSLLALSPDENEWLEFKENSRPLNDSYLSVMANAAALADENHATIVIGVAEDKDQKTGVTTARIIGLDEDLHSAEERISAAASNTTGLGKTMEAGLIARELLLRKKASTIVVAAPPSVARAVES